MFITEPIGGFYYYNLFIFCLLYEYPRISDKIFLVHTSHEISSNSVCKYPIFDQARLLLLLELPDLIHYSEVN
jgi:hypothetical protein